MIKCRLLLLADRLDKIAATPLTKRTRIFDISTWFRRGDQYKNGRRLTCGTAACAIGEATTMRHFRDLGLRYSFRAGAPVFGKYRDWDAVARFFKITHHQATSLFMHTGYHEGQDVGPGGVADKIRHFVETGEIA